MIFQWNRGSEKRVVTLLTLFASALISVVATAADYKLTINKEQNASNVIVFKDQMSATVKHTAEGMELTIPGVSVALACESTDSSTGSDACVITVGPSTTVATTAPAPTGTSSGDDGCVNEGTWNTCGSADDASSTDNTTSTDNTSSTNDASSTDNSGSTSTSNNTTMVASTSGSPNYGSGGGNATGNSEAITLTPGETLALPFSVVPGSYSGTIGIVPTSLGFPTDGSQIRMWFSRTAGGAALADRWCSNNLGSEGAVKWSQKGEQAKCPIPNEKADMFVNVRLCISDRKDRSCNGPNVKNGTESATVFIAGWLYQ